MGLPERTLGDVSSGRYDLWPIALEGLKKNFLFGRGRGSFQRTFLESSQPVLARHPHNAYIEILLDMGVVGSIFFLGFYIFLIKKGWFIYKKNKDTFESGFALGFILSIIATFLEAYSGYTFYPRQENFYIWLFLGILMRIEKDQEYSITHNM
jgi:O-antigen ligase